MGVLSQKTPYRLCSCKFNRQIFPLSHTLHHLLISITHLTNRSHYSSLPSRNLETVNNLISIFTNQEKNPSFSEELTKFGSNLTTDVVEITLKSFKNWKTALRFFNWSSNQNGYHHNCYTYNAMASILSGVRQNAAVKKLFADLVNSRCYVSPDEKEMISILNEAKNHVNKKSMATLYNSALYNLVKHGSTDKAYGLIRSIMKDTNLVSVETESFEIVINDLCQKGELDKALDLFNDMDLIGCKRSLLLYNNLINAFSDAKKVEKCHELLNEMKKHGFTPSNFTHNSIFGYYCKIGDFNGAINMLHEFRAHGNQPWIKHYTFLVKKLSVNRKMAEASNFLIMMVELGFNPDIIVYSAVIDGWLKIEEVDYALKMFKDISVNGRFPDVVTYNTIINGLCKAKRVSEAREIYNDMVQKSLVPSVVTYNLLIDAYCKNNDVDQAVDFFSMMSEKNRNPNVVTYTSLIDGLCNVGRSDEASIIWEKMVCNCKPNEISYMVMINGLCKCGKPDLGLTYFAEMEEKHMKADTYVYVMLIDAFICVSNAPSGFSIFRKMIRDERLPNSGDKNCVILREIVVKLLNDVRTCDEMRMIIADGSVPIYLLQTSGS